MDPPGTYSRKMLRWVSYRKRVEVLYDVFVLERLEQLDLALERIEHALLALTYLRIARWQLDLLDRHE